MARILLIDDDPLVLATIEMCLAEESHDVTAANSRLNGLAALALGNFDIVVTDSLLGSGTGDDMATSARKAGLPVLVISGTRREDRSFPFLEKPFLPRLLLATIDRLLRAPASAAVR